MNILALFRRRPSPPNPRVVQLINDIRTGDADIHTRRVPIIYLKSGWSVASVGYRLVSIQEIQVTKYEERAICDAIADRLADYFRRP